MASLTPSHYTQEIFETAKREFLADFRKSSQASKADLQREILTTAVNIDQVYSAVEKLQADQIKQGHFRNVARIGPFLQALESYAHSVEVFVSAKPEILALIWGPIKLLMLWTTNIKNGFEAVMDIASRIGQLLPQFDRVHEVIRNDERIKSVLALFYRDILDFYSVALKFFGQSRWQIVFDALWPKSRAQIKVVEDNIEKHAQLLREEVTLDHIRLAHEARIETLDAFRKADEFRCKQRFQALQVTINPRLYDGKLDWLRGRACKTTSKWLGQEPEFIQWMDVSKPSSKILWLQGIPGAGKTFLAGWVVNRTISESHRTLYAFASHVYADTTAISIIHGLLFQLASDDPDVQSILSEAKERDLKSNTEFAKSILKSSLQSTSGATFVVVDGLDEVDSFERKQVLFLLLDMLKTCPNTRICVSSRMEDDIGKTIGKDATAIRVEHKNGGSIQSYVNTRVGAWVLDSGFDNETSLEVQGLMSSVVAYAKGMFLYARIVIDNVELLTDIDEIRREMRALPRDLDAAYERVFARLNNLPPAKRDKARKILGWIGCSPLPLTMRELEQALAVKKGMQDLPLVKAPTQVVPLCGPIVEITNNTPQFVHFTVKEYIFNAQVKESLSLSVATADLLETCIRYLGCPALRYEALKRATEEETREHLKNKIVQGRFRLLRFAVDSWLPLASKYLALFREGASPEVLGPLLDRLSQERENEGFKQDSKCDNTPRNMVLRSLLDDWPEAAQLLSRAFQFGNHPDRDKWTIDNPKLWVPNDPLTVSKTCSKIENAYARIACPSPQHLKGDKCHCPALKSHYGDRLHKCIFLTCPHRRIGFSSAKDCENHIISHDRPFKCRELGCPYAELRFLTEQDRSNHWLKCHYRNVVAATTSPSIPTDVHELQLLLFGLITSQQFDKLQEIVPAALERLRHAGLYNVNEMTKLAASIGSLPITRLLMESAGGPAYVGCYDNPGHSSLFRAALNGRNAEVVRYLLHSVVTHGGRLGHGNVVTLYPPMLEIIKSPLLEAGAAMRDVITEIVCPDLERKEYRDVVPTLFDKGCLFKEAKQNPMQEIYLLEIWQAMIQTGRVDPWWIGNALVRVAERRGSVEQARFLIEVGGAEVNHPRVDIQDHPKVGGAGRGRGRTALHWAARDTSEEAAKIMRLLLEKGADPGLAWAGVKPEEEKGAKGIAKWLGVTWQELVQSTTAIEPPDLPEDEVSDEASSSSASQEGSD